MWLRLRRALRSLPTRRSSDLLGHDVMVEALARPNARGQGSGVLASVKAVLPKRLFEFSGLAYNAIDRTTVARAIRRDRKSTRLNSSHLVISYAVFCLKRKKIT